MRPNGLQLVVEMGVKALRDARAHEHREALVLGALRENVRYVPGIGVLDEHLSLSHFYGPGLPGGFVPFLTVGARGRAERLFKAAVHSGPTAAGFVQMGRVAHLVADMACPVHVHRVAHWSDAFEWYVDAHCDELSSLPVAEPPPGQPARLIEDLARRTQRLAPDRTHNVLGWALRKLHLRKAPHREELARQAREIIPHAAGTFAALLRMFLG
jgi:hypothetical protein